MTRGVDRFVNDTGTLGIFDCEGFELGRSTREAVKWIKAQLKSNRQGQVLDRIHVVWYCVQWSDRRMTDGQVELIKELSGMDLPVILVMTQVPLRDGELHGDAVAFAKYLDGLDLPIVGGKVFMTDAVGDRSWSDVLTGLAGTSVWVVVLAGAGWLQFKKEGTTLH